MDSVQERIFVGTDLECREGDAAWAIVHACKSPCHQRAVGYRGSLSPSHPNYLVLEKPGDLFLNIIDPPQPLFMPPLFTSFLGFASRHWDAGRSLLIHCNLGESRAPSLAMLFMAKHTHTIDGSSFDSAAAEFRQIFTRYTPGLGIQAYLRKHWDEF
jgi:hypothetical protein